MNYRKRFTLLLFSLFLSMHVGAQTISDMHVLLEDTNIYIIPPDSFVETRIGSGFEHPDNFKIGISINQMAFPFSKTRKSIEYDSGKHATGVKKLEISGMSGFLEKIEYSGKKAGESQYQLIFGNEKITYFAYGRFLNNDPEIEALIKQSLLSIVVDDANTPSVEELLKVKIDLDNADLQLISIQSDAATFKPKNMSDPDYDVALILSTFRTRPASNKKQYAMSYAEGMGSWEIDKKKTVNEVNIDDLLGYEMFLLSDSYTEVDGYSVMLFDDENNTYYLFFGYYKSQDLEAIQALKSVIFSFQRIEQ